MAGFRGAAARSDHERPYLAKFAVSEMRPGAISEEGKLSIARLIM
jgi:hypothetical protein